PKIRTKAHQLTVLRSLHLLFWFFRHYPKKFLTYWVVINRCIAGRNELLTQAMRHRRHVLGAA
ncbi:hypothetical protein, partial [Acetobacter aceti]|uniref:hypothetical protein n=1 Tax=Acetobacter aceti TaxID=435 RepID=UPI001C60AEE4